METEGGGFYFSSNSNSNSQFTGQIQGGFGSGEIFSLGNNESSGGGEEFHPNMMVVGPWGTAAQENNRFHLLDEDSSLRCVFPCEPNERPSQGLSLSLSSSNPCSIGLQSFELRPQQQNQQQNQPSSFPIFQLRNSRFLAPAQELLYEFCSIGITNNNKALDRSSSPKQHKPNKPKHWELEDGSSSTKPSLQSLDFMELQKRKTKLFSMLEEVKKTHPHNPFNLISKGSE